MLSVFGAETKAQLLPDADQAEVDTVSTSILPIVIYTSDLGLLGAVLYNRRRNDVDDTGAQMLPYINSTEMSAEASTKGLFGLRLVYEQRETFGYAMRSRWIVQLQRDPADLYFGIGNDSSFNKENWEAKYYEYLAYRGELSWLGRSTVYVASNNRGYLDVITAVQIGYEKPQDEEGRLFGIDQPLGIDGGWLNMIGTGILWENRDSEVAATRGNRFELTASYSPGLIFSDYHMAKFSSDYRQYITLPIPYFFPVLAGRIAGEWAVGTVPFWELPYLGDQYTLRGYPWYRFRGEASLLYNIEIRTWVYQFDMFDLKLGVHGFRDAGRVFDAGDSFSDIFNKHHRTYGVGIAASAFSPYLVFRLDVGFSEDMMRIYMNMGYMF